ncbi:YwbE family protein [Niallia sp. Krafla_26]|uniref:YwbE family protein n=1 Tax=Niallia sp. Krafla_26 TaxID=3064703 RepID=UPI003D173EA0
MSEKEVDPLQGTIRENIKIGLKVKVVQKQDQRTGKLTEGIVSKILTKSPNHHHGIKVMLENGIVGRVKEIEG